MECPYLSGPVTALRNSKRAFRNSKRAFRKPAFRNLRFASAFLAHVAAAFSRPPAPSSPPSGLILSKG